MQLCNSDNHHLEQLAFAPCLKEDSWDSVVYGTGER